MNYLTDEQHTEILLVLGDPSGLGDVTYDWEEVVIWIRKRWPGKLTCGNYIDIKVSSGGNNRISPDMSLLVEIWERYGGGSYDEAKRREDHDAEDT